MHVDDFEDYLEQQDQSLKEQIKQGYRDYLHSKARDVSDILKELRPPTKRLKKQTAR
jgi:hypothetical protein